jgi:2-polyprenyl-3-methyl-5-hydroxy-6-metoxy-1,4-benzoquinol methylase
LEAQYSEAYYGPDNVKFVPAVEAFVAWMTRKRAEQVHTLMSEQGRILEIGCGRGLLLQQLAVLGHECHGIERSELAARRAGQRRTSGLYSTVGRVPFAEHYLT